MKSSTHSLKIGNIQQIKERSLSFRHTHIHWFMFILSFFPSGKVKKL